MQVSDVEEFLLLAEGAVLSIHPYCESGNKDYEGVVLESQILVRDVLLLQEFLLPDICQEVLDAVMKVTLAAQSISDEYCLRHIEGSTPGHNTRRGSSAAVGASFYNYSHCKNVQGLS